MKENSEKNWKYMTSALGLTMNNSIGAQWAEVMAEEGNILFTSS